MAGAWRTSGSTGREDEPLIGWRPAATAVKVVVGRIGTDSDSGIVRRGIAADEQQAEHEQGQSEIFHRRHLRAGAGVPLDRVTGCAKIYSRNHRWRRRHWPAAQRR